MKNEHVIREYELETWQNLINKNEFFENFWPYIQTLKLLSADASIIN